MSRPAPTVGVDGFSEVVAGCPILDHWRANESYHGEEMSTYFQVSSNRNGEVVFRTPHVGTRNLRTNKSHIISFHIMLSASYALQPACQH